MGLGNEVLAQVTIEGTEDFEEVVAAAQRSELALQLKEKSAQMSSVGSKAFKDAVQEEVSRQLFRPPVACWPPRVREGALPTRTSNRTLPT